MINNDQLCPLVVSSAAAHSIPGYATKCIYALCDRYGMIYYRLMDLMDMTETCLMLKMQHQKDCSYSASQIQCYALIHVNGAWYHCWDYNAAAKIE